MEGFERYLSFPSFVEEKKGIGTLQVIEDLKYFLQWLSFKKARCRMASVTSLFWVRLFFSLLSMASTMYVPGSSSLYELMLD